MTIVNSTTSVNSSPSQLALDARVGLNNATVALDAAKNAQLAAQYKESVNQWVVADQQLPAGTHTDPIPDPPASWVEVPITPAPNSPDALYDAQWAGLPKRLDSVQTGPPVAPKYTPPSTPTPPAAGSVLHIGPYMRDGEYSAYPDDNMPDGFITRTADGTWVKKVTLVSPFGKVGIYTTKV